MLAAACESDSGRPDGPTAEVGNPDLDTAAAAAGLERLLVDTYTAARSMAAGGRLGALIPAAVLEFLTTAAAQHQEHLDAWNRLLTAGGRPPVASPDQELKPTVDGAIGRVIDIPGLARLALRLEDYASQTYIKAIPTLTTPDSIRTAAQIVVVDQQHQAVLRYLLGLYPVGSGGARDTRDFAPADPRPELITG